MISRVIFKCMAALVMLIACGLYSGQAKANTGFDRAVGDMFGAMSNTTDPHVFMSAKRGVISGGGIEVRNRTMNYSLMSFQAPSISVGCNGISAFFGSFSFITKEQLQQAMRAIATAAVMYAFKIALAAMCPTCEEKLSALQDKMDKLTASNINACEIGEKLVRDTKLEGAIQEKARAFGTAIGYKDDRVASGNFGEGKSASAEAAGRMTQAQKDEVFKGNQAWRVMKDKGLGKWGVGVSKELLEDVMSFTGTIVACVPNVDAGCVTRVKIAGAAEDVSVSYKNHTMDLASLVKGSEDNKPVVRLVCDTADLCLNPQGKEVTDYKGIESQIKEIFVGEAGLGGIVAKVAIPGATEPTADELGWIATTGAYGEIVLNLAKQNPEAARNFVNQFSEEMAVTVIDQVMRTYLQSVLTAMNATENSDTTEFRKMVRDAQDRLQMESVPFFQKARGKTAHLEYYERIRGMAATNQNMTMSPAQ